MAERLSIEPSKLVQTLKKTVFSSCKTEEEFASLCVVANEHRLNPLTREIYAYPGRTGGIVPIVSVDGWIRIINEHPQMDGIDFECVDSKTNEPVSCTCIIWRKDRSKPIRVTEYYAECRRPTEPWKMSRRMLRHKALIQCARVAFGFGGIYDEDEGRIIGESGATIVDVTADSKADRLAERLEGKALPVEYVTDTANFETQTVDQVEQAAQSEQSDSVAATATHKPETVGGEIPLFDQLTSHLVENQDGITNAQAVDCITEVCRSFGGVDKLNAKNYVTIKDKIFRGEIKVKK
jgi:phage recombination protein Bet